MVYGNYDIDLGDKVKVSGKVNKIEKNTIFNLSSYKDYMNSKGIKYTLIANKITILNKNKNILYKFKNYLVNKIKTYKNSKYLYAFILGNTSYIEDKIKNSYINNGITHLFAISGMHISLISFVILYILNKIKKSNINSILVIIFLFIYSFLVNFTPSVIRTILFFLFNTINKCFKLELNKIRIFIIILCIVLIINPFNVYNLGFKLSYVIFFYLLIFEKIINKSNKYLLKIFYTSLIAFLSSLPIVINTYFSINLITILNNIIFVPLVSIIIFPMSIVILFIPKLSIIFDIFIYLLENLSIFLDKFKLILVLKHISAIVVLLYYLIITYILYMISKNKYQYIIMLICMLFIHSHINNFDNSYYVTFIDVGQGDSMLIKYPFNGGNILLDTGGSHYKTFYKNTINYLKSIGISKLDYLVITHGDFDHMGEAINLVNNFKVEKVIFNCGPYNDLEKELIKILDKMKIKYYSCIKELNIGNNKLHFLQTKEYDNENDNSNVIYTKISGYKFMFMGDASTTTEKEIMNKYNLLDIDVLKVGHHGSKTSSSEEFIDEINPKYSIISVGKNNRYGHPNKETLDNLKESKIYRTDKVGSIMFKIKNNKLRIKTCDP